MTQRKIASSLFILTVSGAMGLNMACTPEQTLAGPPASSDQGGTGDTGGAGGDAAGGAATATGGTRPANAGGAPATGGAGTAGAGGVATNTGGTVATAAGGIVATATGGVKATATGGTVATATGGTVATATGGTIATATGGTIATAATGGAPPAATGGAATLTSCTPSGPLAVGATSNYVTTGTCSGYPFTFATAGVATVSPVCGAAGCTPAFAATQLCATGSVGISATSAAVAGVGFNLLQGPTAATPTLFALPGTSMTISFTNTGAVPLRAQLAADSTGTLTWCYDLAGKTSPVTIPLSSFNTTCWTPLPAGAFVPGTSQVVAVQLLIPSNAKTATAAFNVCLTGVSIP